MANKIFMADADKGGDLSKNFLAGASIFSWDVFPLHDEIQMDIGSEFGSIGEDLGEITNLIQFVTKWSTNFSGKQGEGMANLQNMLDAPRWNKTKPVSIQFSLYFYTKTKAEDDVYGEMMKWMEYCILSYEPGTKAFKVPGFSLANASNFTNAATGEINAASQAQINKAIKDNKISTSSKLIQVFIPGVIYLYPALVMQAQPTFSKEVTESNFPLWGKLDMQVSGVYPAHSQVLENTKRLTNLVMRAL